MEFCKGGDLSKILSKVHKLTEPVIQAFLKQVVAGLGYLHSQNIIHRDLKPQNILIESDEALQSADIDPDQCVLKIADFGLAKQMEKNQLLGTGCGTLAYMAPEIMCQSKYDSKADIWSLGVILYECMMGKLPFDFLDLPNLMTNYKSNGKGDLKLDISGETSGFLKDLLRQMLQVVPEKRGSYKSVTNHPFLKTPQHPTVPCQHATAPTQKTEAEWKQKAYSKMVDCGKSGLDVHDTRHEVIDMLSSSYPLYTWFVHTAPKDLKYSLKYRLDGFGEMAEWRNDPECTHNMYLYKVATSKLRDRGGKCTDEDKKKAVKIVDDVGKSDMCGANSNCSVDRVAEEVESRLNRDSLHWLTIEVWERETGYGWSEWFDHSNFSNIYKSSDKYFIDVYLSN
ncbi:calcium/calmodulin-dependent protein kinase type 1-like isoform X2 [Symsagittifera roscoffensis]